MTCVWNRRLVSSGLMLLLLSLAGVGLGAERLRPAPGIEDEIWKRYGVEDAAWAATWPGDWLRDEQPDSMAPDSLTARLQRLVKEVSAVTADTVLSGGELVQSAWSDRLRTRWHRRGYLNCRITLAEDSVGVLIVDPGLRYRLGEVSIDGLDRLGDPERLRRLLPRSDDPFDAEQWERAVANILAVAGDGGRPFVSWTVRDLRLRPLEHRIDIDAALAPGDPMILGMIDSNLPEGPGRNFLIRASGLHLGELFRQSRLHGARTRLETRGIYHWIGDPVVFVTAAPGTVGVYWPVKPIEHPNQFALVLGLSRRSNDEPTRLSGQVDLRMGNIAGTGRRLDLAWSDDGGDRSHFGFGWLEPLAVGTPLDLELEVDQEVVADIHTQIRLDGSILLPVAGAWGIELGLGRDRVSYPLGTWSRSARWRSRGALHHRRGDRFSSGWSGTFSVESARRSVSVRNEADVDEVSSLQEQHQTLVELELDGELWLAEAMSMGLRGRFADVSGQEGVTPLVEQYRLGGARSLRGYREDQYHGERVAAAALELRLGRPDRSRVYSFLDLGYVRLTNNDPIEDVVFKTVERPLGFGLGLETKAPGGNVSLAIGFPGTIDFEVAKLHVSLIQAF